MKIMLERFIIIFKKAFAFVFQLLKKVGIFLKDCLLFILRFLKKLIFVDSSDGKNGWWETFKNVLIALILAIIIRSLLYEPFHIPSGSMKPGLKEGDFIFTSKYDFGYTKYSFPFGLPIFKNRIFFNKKPQRGDVLVFRLPSNPNINYIKRLIGLPGDKIQIRQGNLYVNDEIVPKSYIKDVLENENDKNSKVKEYKETLNNGRNFLVLDRIPNSNGDNTGVFIVPSKHYFFMGDNRDNSLDSRFIETGFVPEKNLIGKARIIFFSAKGSFLKFWEWPQNIRWNRIFKKIK